MSEAQITCPVCGMTSHNRDDAELGYCANCHDWTYGEVRERRPGSSVWIISSSSELHKRS